LPVGEQELQSAEILGPSLPGFRLVVSAGMIYLVYGDHHSEALDEPGVGRYLPEIRAVLAT